MWKKTRKKILTTININANAYVNAKLKLQEDWCAKELVWLLEFSTFEITTTATPLNIHTYGSDKCSTGCACACVYDLAQKIVGIGEVKISQ